jgi:cytochrome c-type biogenesis protein
LDEQRYALEQWANQWVGHALNQGWAVSVGVVAIAGLLTSLTPCMLSMLPITLGYIGGYGDGYGGSEAVGEGDGDSKTFTNQRFQALVQSLWFALGLATTLTLLGVGAVLLGQVYGQVGGSLPIVVSVVAILMGLNLLEIVPLRLPGVTLEVPQTWPRGLRSYALGVTFGVVASPCSTPVLATLLAWVSASHDPWRGAVLLLSYALGYVSPLVLAGAFVGTVKRLLALRQWSGWINPFSGIVMIGFGVFSLLTRLFPTV